ncbi:hypothetical protein N8H69_05405 [Achromobacter spanius]|uniref:hypothetical protein n=1 Tax=Achromobacter spanius TaxID=217203 RepID=UPI002226D6C5|nr:hypothetical protein [Achromobacter spanius]MCW3151962.1 hypothetical protein [Achromobacter spanius]
MNGREIDPTNPAQLTRYQHVHAARCIKHFAGEDGKVGVCLLGVAKTRLLPKDPVFCAKRAWSQQGESALMRDNIERRFFSQLGRAVHGYPVQDHEAVSEYFFLWQMRRIARERPIPDMKLNGITGTSLTPLQRQRAEAKHVVTIDHDAKIGGQHATTIQILRGVDERMLQYPDLKWGVLKATSGEFIVADGYAKPRFFFPVTPSIALMEGQRDCRIDQDSLRKMNRRSIEESRAYFFARDISKCLL